MKLLELLDALHAVANEQGNIDTFHDDAEWGIGSLSFRLGKIIDRPNGSMTYKSLVSQEDYEFALETLANKLTAEELGKMWDESPEAERFMSREELIKNNLQFQAEQADVVKQYEAAPWSVVF